MTRNDDPDLYFAEDGAPRSGRFGDIYYSLQDGLAESRAVFLTGCHLPDAWADRDNFSLLELGFGTGLNLAAVMQAWAQTRKPGAHLHIFTIEGFLMQAAESRRALSSWPELEAYAEALLAQWPRPRRGFAYMDFPQWGVSITIALMDVRAALTSWGAQDHAPLDAIFLDGFSPALNEDMWGKDVFALIAQSSRPGTRLATFTVAGVVRRGLQAVGFQVAKVPGFGRKRERLEAVFGEPAEAEPTGVREQSHRMRKIAIVGAGIAGCALVHEAKGLGLEVDLFDADAPGCGASGNARALVTPRLDAGDNEISALFADAFAYAGDLYRRLCPQAITGQGVRQCEATPKDASRFTRIAAQTGFAADELSLFKAGDAPDMPHAAGITLHHALWVVPQLVLEALLAGTPVIRAQIIDFTRSADGRISLTTRGADQFDGYDAVILACGDGIFDLKPVASGHDWRADYDLRPVRGQLEIVPHRTEESPLCEALSWGGYAIPLEDGFLFGTTHEREDRGIDVREADRTRNLDSLAKAMPARAAAASSGPFRSRASIRVMTRDYLPLAGPTGEAGLYVLSGLGARGFCLAPLLAKALLAEVAGLPQPLPAAAKKMLVPKRLLPS